jgi:CspA family cold shock protein
MKKRGKEFGGPRRRGFDDDNFDFDPSQRRDNRRSTGGFPGGPTPGFAPMPSMPSSGPLATATVSWFNSEKGFGFVALTDGSGDAFLHASTLEAIGLKVVPPGATIKCRVAQGQKGMQVAEVVEVDETTAAAAPPRPRPAGPRDRPSVDLSSAESITGTVKWYSPEKGFGFAVADDGGKDVFIHASALQRSGLMSLAPAEIVKMKVIAGVKGREAVEVSVGES